MFKIFSILAAAIVFLSIGSVSFAVSPTTYTLLRDTNYNTSDNLPAPDYTQGITVSNTTMAQDMSCPAGTALACITVSGTGVVSYKPNGTGTAGTGTITDGTAWPEYNSAKPCMGYDTASGIDLTNVRFMSSVSNTDIRMSCYSQ